MEYVKETQGEDESCFDLWMIGGRFCGGHWRQETRLRKQGINLGPWYHEVSCDTGYNYLPQENEKKVICKEI